MKKRHARTIVALATTLFAACASEACGTSSGNLAPVTTDGGDAARRDARAPFTEAAMRDAANAFNAVYCPAFKRCDPVAFERTFGPLMETCLGAGGLVAIPASEVRFVDELAAPYAFGSRLTPAVLRACADALDFSDTSTCVAWVRFTSERTVPAACEPAFRGDLDENVPCGVWNQCKSGRCLPNSTASAGSCGLCTALTTAGSKCQEHACAPGSSCRRTSATVADLICTPYAGVGEACEPSEASRAISSTSPRPCRDELVCNAATKKCANPLPNGACDADMGCSAVPRLRYCDAGQCRPVPLAKLGEPCGDVGVGALRYRACERGGACTQVAVAGDAGADASTQPAPRYECLALIEDGDACTGTFDDSTPCKRPDSRCFRDICQQNGAPECAAPPVLP